MARSPRSLSIPAAILVFALALGTASTARAASWAKTYGGAQDDVFWHTEPTADGGFIACGYTLSSGAGGEDGLVVKVDPLGTVQYAITLGGANNDQLRSIVSTWDGGYVAVGHSFSFVGTGNHGGSDLWVVKLGDDLSVDWQRLYGGVRDDGGRDIVQCRDGNYAVAGYTQSMDGARTDDDGYLLKVSYGDGQSLWALYYGGAAVDYDDRFYTVAELANGTLAATGSTRSFDPLLGTAAHIPLFTVNPSTGQMIQQFLYFAGAGDEEAYGLQATADGGCVLTGSVARGSTGFTDLVVLKLDSAFAVQYQQIYGGGTTLADCGLGIDETHAADTMVPAGTYYLVTGYLTQSTLQKDLWALKLDHQLRAGTTYPGTWQKTFGVSGNEEGTCIRETYDGGAIVSGSDASSGAGALDGWILKLPATGTISATTGCGTDTDLMASVTFARSSPPGQFQNVFTDVEVSQAPAPVTPTVATQCASCTEDAYEPDDNRYLSPAVIRGGEIQSHNFCDDGEDWVTFNGCAGTPYTLTVTGYTTNVSLTLYYGDEAVAQASGTTAITDFTPTQSGSFHLRVATTSPPGSGTDYTLSLTGSTASCPSTNGSYVLGVPGADENEEFRHTTLAPDGGTLSVGSIESSGNRDLWAVRQDIAGAVLWQKSYGGSGWDEGIHGATTGDGGFVVCGTTDSIGAGSKDGWVLKLDSDLSVQWQVAYGGTYDDELLTIRPTWDGGYIAVGYRSNSATYADNDLWVIKLASDGSVQWQKTLGGSGAEYYPDLAGMDIRPTPEGGYIVASVSSSFTASDAAWLVKLDPWGTIQWQYVYGGAGSYEFLYGVDITQNRGYIVAGAGYFRTSYSDSWVMRLEPFGKVEWQKHFGDAADFARDEASSVKSLGSGDFLVRGYSDPYPDPTFVYIFKLDDDGVLVWEEAGVGVGRGYTVGTAADQLYDTHGIEETPDGSMITAFATSFFDPPALDGWSFRPNPSGLLDSGCYATATAAISPGDTYSSPTMSTAWPSDWSSTRTVTAVSPVNTSAQEVAPPESPTDVSATPGCSGNSVTWTGSTGADSYNVLRGTTCGTALDTFTDVTSPYNDASAVAGTPYQYWVVAVNTCGTSPDSACDEATRPYPTPAAPTGVSVTPGCSGNSVAWTGSAGASSYNVLRAASCGGGSPTTFTGVTSPYNDATAVAGTLYYYWVVAVNSCGTSPDSPCDDATRPYPTPAAPAAPTFSSVLCDSLTVEWGAVAHAATYDVWRATGNGTCSGAVKVNAAPVAGLSYGDSGLSGSTQYSYYITATNSCGTSSNGTCAAQSTIPCAVYPIPDGGGATTAMKATKTSSTDLSVTFDTGSCPNPGASYNLLYGNLADVSTCTLSGSACGIASGGSWTFPPVNTFWVIVAKVGPQESSWGKASDGDPRSLVASNRCGATSIDTTSTCPP